MTLGQVELQPVNAWAALIDSLKLFQGRVFYLVTDKNYKGSKQWIEGFKTMD